jgi:hypothetical protein
VIRDRLAATPDGDGYPLGRVLAVYGALMVTLLLAALDQTIVVTALPRIVADVGGLTSYSWMHELTVATKPGFLFAACVCLAALALVAVGLREEPLRRSLEEKPVRSGL